MNHGNEKYPVPLNFVEEFNSIHNCTIRYFEQKYGVSTLTVKRWARLTGVKFIKSNATLEEIYGEDFIKEKILSCKTPADANTLVKELGVTKVKIMGACRRLGLDCAHLEGKTMREAPPKDELVKLIEEGKTNQEIELIYNCTNPVLKRWYKELGIVRDVYEGRIAKIPDDFVDWYKSFKPTKRDISDEYGVSYPTASRWIRDCGLEYKGMTTKKPIPPKEDLIILNDKKIGTAGIAAHYKIGQVLARQWLYHYNIDIKYDASGKSQMELEVLSFLNINGGNFISRKSVLENPYYELDGYDKSKRMAFEFCGLFWHSYEQNPITKRRHREKFLMADDKNIKLYTIFENEWVNSPDLVKSMLLARMGIYERIYARKTIVQKISSLTAEEFHRNNHISGYVRSSYNVGLFFEGKIVSVMSFSKSRYNKSIEWEITRYSTTRGAQIVGGASKLFNHFRKEMRPKSVISYADLRWGRGNVYTQMGFERVEDTVPGYYYFKQGKYELHSRMKFQKRKLKNLLENYDENLSESVNMSNHNYYRIYDCGHARYIWKERE